MRQKQHINISIAQKKVAKAEKPDVVKEAPVELSNAVIIELLLDVATAKSKFNIDLEEDFVFEGTYSELTKEQEEFLMKISEDGTVDGGIDVIEAL